MTAIGDASKPMGQNALKRKLIEQLLKKYPDWSNRRIAEETKKYMTIILPDDEDTPR